MKDVLIIGSGVVGRNLTKELSALHPDVVDKYSPEYNAPAEKVDKKYDFAFICIDTPKTTAFLCDTAEIENALEENDAEIYIIKSTVLPGTTKRLAETSGKTIIFSPEYYGETQHCNNFRFDYTVFGGERNACLRAVQLLQNVYDARHSFRVTDSETAELSKYMGNSYLATKVSFCVQFWEIAKHLGIDYEELRELFILDPRVNPSHTFVYDNRPYWESHCLSKDVAAIAQFSSAEFLKNVILFNENQKEKFEVSKS